MATLVAKSLYSLHPSFAHAQAIIDNLPETTGRSIEVWVELLAKQGLKTVKEQQDWLKAAHKLKSATAGSIAEWAEHNGLLYNPEAYVESMFAGPKAALRPLYDELLRLGMGLGSDVKACPCQTIVPLYRKHVFAQIKPSTKTRLDLGLWLPQTDGVSRLIPTGGLEKGDRITYRIAVSSPADIDDELRHWLRTAYERDV